MAADYLGMAGMADVSGGRTHEIVRLELVAEALIQEIANPADYVDEFGQRLHELARSAVGFKTVLAYRAGFDRNLSRPAPAAVAEAARRWQENPRSGTQAHRRDAHCPRDSYGGVDEASAAIPCRIR